MEELGTDQNLLISNALSDDVKAVDSFAKLTIMTEAHDNYEDNIPQIMLTQTTNNEIKTWNGDRLTINYASGADASYFAVSEITGNYRNRLNLEIFGESNVFNGNVTGTYGNSFIYSRSNKLTNLNNNINFLHSDYNNFYIKGLSNLNFVQSNDNTFYNEGNGARGEGISLFNSNNNSFLPTVTYNQEGSMVQNSVLDDISLFNSNYNYIKGRTKAVELNGDKLHNTTFINSNSGLYELNSNQDSITMIGNSLGYVTNMAGGNIIGIGEGLIQNGGNSDKIILGFYNQNSTNPDEILIVGDGKLNRTYVESLVGNNKSWYNNSTDHRNIINSFSDTGATALNSNHYRHNIFTVNKNGYITISDYRVPSNSARYGYKGITAFVDGSTYDIPFEKLYMQIDNNNAVDLMQEKIDSYTEQIRQKLASMPTLKYESFSDPVGLASNIKTSAYLNLTAPEVTGAMQIQFIDETKNNDILNITYQPDINTTNKRLPATLVWSYYLPVEKGVSQREIIASTDIYPYCTKQFIVCKPTLSLNKNAQKPFSGFTLIEQETQNTLTITTGSFLIPSKFVLSKATNVDDFSTYSYYNGDATTYDGDAWTILDDINAVTIFDTSAEINTLVAGQTIEGTSAVNPVLVS